MSSNPSKPSSDRLDASISIFEVLRLTFRKWPWVLLSVFVCCGIGILYLLITPPKYSQTAALIIKDEDEGGSVSKELSSMGLFKSSANIENEVATFESPDLMEKVVEDLDLTYNYYTANFLGRKVLYGKNLPVTVSISGISEKAKAGMKVKVFPNGDVEIYKCTYVLNDDKKKSDTVYKGKLAAPVKTILGEVTIKPTAYYDKSEEVEIKVTKSSLFDAVEANAKSLSVEADEDGGNVITLNCKNTSVERADNILSTLINVYKESWIEEKNLVAIATSNFINERLKVIEKELGNVDSDISEFQSSTLMPNVRASAAGYASQNEALTSQILSLNSELSIAQYMKEYVTAPAHRDAVLPSNVGMSEKVASAIDNYNYKLMERNNLASKSSDQNPLVVNMDEDLAQMRNAIIANIDNYIHNLKTRIASAQGERSETREKLTTTPSQAKYLLSVERQQKVKENLYLFLLQKREDNEINLAFTAQNFRLIQRPGGNDEPIAPKKAIVMLVCLVLGVGLPAAWKYYRLSTDTKVHGRSDTKVLSMPFMGEIPLYKGKVNTEKNILVRPGARDGVNESFRVLRTNLDFVRPDKTGEAFTIAVTSINPASGKSFITANVAAAIGIRHKKVLLIDADLRRGSTSEYAGAPKQGLSDYLAGRVKDVRSLIVKVPESDGLDMLPIGSIPPNPTELIESPLFGSMLDELKKEYDYIFLDCPPIDIVADTRIIDKFVDRTIFIIRAGLLDKEQLPEIDDLYTSKKYKNMVYVLNGTQVGGKNYGNVHYGTYGYGNAPTE
ncbi:MAG: polysaccharide biosynthesis tyrosine autokinase [Muribaculaceae bacterium]|nr:polysaccharide biosynthesis tyrosine autokinase [Muribaculaceae bacterium]